MSNHLKGKSALPVHLSKRLFISCVLLPICLALTAIFSTTLPTSTQNKLVMGVPIILWFWLVVAFIVCLKTIIFALSMSSFDDNGDDDD